MSAYWGSYFRLIDGKPASIVLDMAAWQEIDTAVYRYAFIVRFHVKQPNEDGFPIEDEAAQLNSIEESFIASAINLRYFPAGRVTTAGRREIIFYSSRADERRLLMEAYSHYSPAAYAVDAFKVEEDKSWKLYFDLLYPNPYQFQHMGNQRVVKALQEAGDKLEKPRKVEHFVLFEDEKKMKSFAEVIQEEGFEIEEGSFETEDEGNYVVYISRVDSVKHHVINDVTDRLLQLVGRYEGEYDGWKTIVMEEQ